MINRMMKPVIWSVLRPILSMKAMENQYPGIRPATERIKFPTPSLRRLCISTIEEGSTFRKLRKWWLD